MEIVLRSIAIIHNSRNEIIDDDWANIISEICLDDHIPVEAFDHISNFSHLEILYYFDQSIDKKLSYLRRPRGNPDFPEIGIFAQRNSNRRNQIGLCTVQLIEHQERVLKVKYLDAINGTPVLDIKPVFKKFEPSGEIKEPKWVGELLHKYW